MQDALQGKNRWFAYVASDLDADGSLDVVMTAGQASGVYLNDGRGRFARVDDALAQALSSRSNWQTTVDSLADFDEDGRPEMLVVTPMALT